MSTREQVYLRVTRADIAVILCNADGGSVRTLVTQPLPVGAFADDAVFTTALETALLQVSESVNSVTVILPEELMYTFSEPVATLKDTDKSARARISRMVPAPADELIWNETQMHLMEPLLNLSEPFCMYMVMRRSLAEGIAAAVREKTKVHATFFMSATTALWNTLATPPEATSIVLHTDAHAIDLGLFPPNALHPLMTLSIPTPTKKDAEKEEISNLMTRTIAYTRDHYHAEPTHVVLCGESERSRSLKTLCEEQKCEHVPWKPRTATTPEGDEKSEWALVCSVLATHTHKGTAVPGISVVSENPHAHDIEEIRSSVTTHMGSALAYVRTHMGRNAGTGAASAPGNGRIRNIIAIVVCVASLGLLSWVLMTYL